MDESTETSQAAPCCDWRKTVEDLSSSTERFVHDDPAKAMGVALLGGILLTVLPVGRLFGAFIRLAFALVRPILLILGAVKLYEEVQKPRRQ